MPSLTLILSCVAVAFVAHSLYVFISIFMVPTCSKEPCFDSFLATEPKLQLILFTSAKANPISNEVHLLHTEKDFDYNSEFERDFDLPIPVETRKNGTMHLHVVVAQGGGPALTWTTLKRDGPTIVQRIALTDYSIPKATLFNLIGEEAPKTKKKKSTSSSSSKPVAHLKPKIYFSMLTDIFQLGPEDIPPELANLIRVNRDHQFMPIVQNDFLQTRRADLEEITKETDKMSFSIKYKPMSIGKLRLLLHMQHAMLALKKLGFSNKDLDDIKGAFSDTNLYLLCGTMVVSIVHLLFDFLSFKNDIAFWRSKKSYAGLSSRTTLWRGFSQVVIFLYLLDSNTSMLVLVPAAIGALIELWKCKKILKMQIHWRGITFTTSDENEASEELTKQIDREGMKYLTYLLYPLCVGGAIYSLIYEPHKSWYSWTINSMVNGVYAFGFLFMMPQLFINYKLKSVAALPWRSFMYKAFNTFIDDIFAFIITMPTAHRLACFRDDIVFLIYLYQRWLYPVDKNRIDDGTSIEKSAGGDIKTDKELKKDK